MPKTKTPKTAARVYRAASYARLSVDDESYGTSGSVLNQHAIIRDFADANGGLSIVAEYSDDGFSGSTFENRPGWGSLLADVETGKVDCIVVKDLSRLGRNYLDAVSYTHLDVYKRQVIKSSILDVPFEYGRTNVITVREILNED